MCVSFFTDRFRISAITYREIYLCLCCPDLERANVSCRAICQDFVCALHPRNLELDRIDRETFREICLMPASVDLTCSHRIFQKPCTWWLPNVWSGRRLGFSHDFRFGIKNRWPDDWISIRCPLNTNWKVVLSDFQTTRLSNLYICFQQTFGLIHVYFTDSVFGLKLTQIENATSKKNFNNVPNKLLNFEEWKIWII